MTLRMVSFALVRALQLPSSVAGRPLLARSLGSHYPTKMAATPNSPSPGHGPGQGDNSSAESRSGARVSKIQQLVRSDSTGGWEKCWEEGVTPWDLGKPTPVLEHLHQIGALPKGRALVPGCGTGYDVTAIACPERFVVGLDISDVAIKKAVEVSYALPNAKYFTFLKEDFFTWQPSELFDLIFDYTFFCAINPEMRSAWAQQMAKLLKPNGELITLMFPVADHAGGPPYKVSVSDYEEVLSPLDFKATFIADNELAVAPRQGREKLGRWRRFSTISTL
ncbi:hypothetical protein SAY86_000056 [Trapa natans]|uniref:Thiol methyltransferase 2 n=1 Tax=Trapa natans TaxID=22666 RepID=A0AAN7M3E9_TRANT|nr:hypothetical protein SAY86_000056 [Trapa natans]